MDSTLVIEHWNQALPKPQNEGRWRLAEIHFKTITYYKEAVLKLALPQFSYLYSFNEGVHRKKKFGVL